MNRGTAGDIIGAGIWTASAVAVSGYTFKAFKRSYSQFPSPGGGFGGGTSFDPLAPFKAAGDLFGLLAPGSVNSGAHQGKPDDPGRKYTQAILRAKRLNNPAQIRAAVVAFIRWERQNPTQGWDDIGVAKWLQSQGLERYYPAH